MKYNIIVFIITFQTGLLGFSQSENVIIKEDLSLGTTSGIMVGGTWVKEGYQPGKGQNHILYELDEPIKEGYVEFEFKGMSQEEIPENGDHGFFAMYDGLGISEPIKYKNAFKQNHFRWNVHWRQNKNSLKSVVSCANASKDHTSEAVFKNSQRDWSEEPTGESFEWDKDQWYTMKIQWCNQSFTVFIDNEVKWQVTGPFDYAPNNQKIWLGSAPGYYHEGTGKYKYWSLLDSMVYKNFKLVSYDQPTKMDRGEVGAFKDKFVWTKTGQAFVPNFIMLDALSKDLSKITEDNLDDFIDEFIVDHGFTGIHFMVAGQWFHIGDKTVSKKDSIVDPETIDKVRLIVQKVYAAGGSVHFWVWGDHQRSQTSRSTVGGIMGKQERRLMDVIAKELGPLKGWTMSYGFDLFEWVKSEQLNEWHEYMWSKRGWNHLMGARSNTNEMMQISESMDYSSYEWHKPWYEELVSMIKDRPGKPSFSEDRYRIRHPSKYPIKDYDEEETRRGLWHHTMAGGVAAIWGNLDGDGVYENKEELKSFSIFWNENKRFRSDMRRDNQLTNGYCLRSSDQLFVYYKEDTDILNYTFDGEEKSVKAIDTQKPYKELAIGAREAGAYAFKAPYQSDWVLVVE